VPPPGASPTITRTGFAGYASACCAHAVLHANAQMHAACAMRFARAIDYFALPDRFSLIPTMSSGRTHWSNCSDVT